MDTSEAIVTLGGVALVAFILWFFFGPKAARAARVAAGGVQEMDVTVRGAYTPDVIQVEAGRPVRLTFLRAEPVACTAQLIFPDFGVVKDLPVGERVRVEFTPQTPGEYPFHCGMSMVRGRLVVTKPTHVAAGDRVDG